MQRSDYACNLEINFDIPFLLQRQAEAAQEVLDRRKRRKLALHCLEADVQRAKQQVPNPSLSDPEQREGYKTMIRDCLALLSTAIATAQAAEISVVQAKRVQTELQSQILAVEAGEQLEAMLASEEKVKTSLKVSCVFSQHRYCPVMFMYVFASNTSSSKQTTQTCMHVFTCWKGSWLAKKQSVRVLGIAS